MPKPGFELHRSDSARSIKATRVQGVRGARSLATRWSRRRPWSARVEPSRAFPRSWQRGDWNARAAAHQLAAAEGQSEAAPRWTESQWFLLTFQCLLFLNVLVLGAEALSFIGPAGSLAWSRIFACGFLLELMCRLSAEGPRTYFQSRSNWFNFAFVVVSSIDAALLGKVGFGPMSALRLVRIERGLRITRGWLSIYKVFQTILKSPPITVRLAGVAFFVAVAAEEKLLGIQSVVGMLAIFGALLLVRQLTGPEPAAVVYRTLEPGKAFLVKWATLFFAPALIKLPLVQDQFSLGVCVRFGVLLFGGFAATLLSTICISSLFPAAPVDDDAEAPAATKPQAAAASPASDNRPYKKRLLPAYLVCMAGSLLAARWLPSLSQNVFMLGASLLGFVGGMLSPKQVQTFVHPMFVCILVTWLAAVIWSALPGSGTTFLGVLASYITWPGAGAILSFMLAPTVAALGVLLFERRRLLRGELLPIAATTAASAMVSLFLTAFLARALAIPNSLGVASLLRCVASPFAADLTGLIGASPTLAIATIVTTGFIGVVLGQPIFDILRLRSPRTRGLSMGSAAHGLGTVALASSEPDAFPYSALGFVLVGTFTSVYLQVPALRALLVRIVLG